MAAVLCYFDFELTLTHNRARPKFTACMRLQRSIPSSKTKLIDDKLIETATRLLKPKDIVSFILDIYNDYLYSLFSPLAKEWSLPFLQIWLPLTPLLDSSCCLPWNYAANIPCLRLLCCLTWTYPQVGARCWVPSLPIWYFWLLLPVVMLCSIATSSPLMFMVVSPVSMQTASWDIVRYALAILKLISLCTVTYLALLYSFSIASFHPDTAYSICGSIAPLYNVIEKMDGIWNRSTLKSTRRFRRLAS